MNHAYNRSVSMTQFTFDSESHTYRLGDVVLPSVSQIISHGGSATDYSHINKAILNRAAEIGNRTHEMISAYHTKGSVLESNDEPVQLYLDGYKKFIANNDIDVRESELRMYCECHMYAGTVDIVGILNGHDVIIDIKTTNSKNKPAWELQTAAYQHLFFGPDQSAKRVVVHLKKGDYAVEKCDDHLAWPRFLLQLRKFKTDE